MISLTELTVKMHRHPLAVSNAVRDVNANLIKMHRGMKDLTLAQDSVSVQKEIELVDKLEKEIYIKFEFIRDRFLGNKDRIQTVVKLFDEWKPVRREVISLIERGKNIQAISITRGKGADHVDRLEQEIHYLITFAGHKADEFLENSQDKKRATLLFISVILIIAFLLTVFIAVTITLSITGPLKKAVKASDLLAVGDVSGDINIDSNDETGKLLRSMENMRMSYKKFSSSAHAISKGDYSKDISIRGEKDHLGFAMKIMTENLRANRKKNIEQNWLKDGLSNLNKLLSGEHIPDEICELTIAFVCRYVNAGMGVFYVNDTETDKLKLLGSFSLSKSRGFPQLLLKGEGIVGQVALDEKPILLKNIGAEKITILTGTTSEKALSAYAFPIVFHKELLGVIEIASHEDIADSMQAFLEQANEIIASFLYSSIQNRKIKELLADSQKQTHQLQRQSDELQQTNNQMEEQQQQLQQQSEELHKRNAQIEERQMELQNQSDEMRIQNEILEGTKQKLEKASQFKSDFLANMSHELRTPLNSVILLSKILTRNEKGNLTDKDVEKISVVHQAGNELLRLINDILDISKIEAGKMELNVTSFESSVLIQEFQNLFSLVAKEKGVEYDLQDNVKGHITSDKDKVSQIVRNFLSNALKFTSQGHVKLLLNKNDNTTYPFSVTVSDTGIGIDSEKKEIIFNAFTQGDDFMSGKQGGTGLGLAISKRLAEMIHGKIVLESKKGRGTSIKLLFAPLPEIRLDQNSFLSRKSERKNVAEIKDEENRFMDDRNSLSRGDTVFLVVEDDSRYVEFFLLELLHKCQVKVLVATTGKGALDILKRYRPDGIFLDINLPDMDGYEVLRDIKSTKELREIPIQIITANDNDNRFNESDIFGFLSKPVDPDRLTDVVLEMSAMSRGKKSNILLIEDSKVLREAIIDLITDNSCRIVEAQGVEEAIKELEQSHFRLLILDLGLRDEDGIQICNYVKENKINVPIIVYTGRDLTRHEEEQIKTVAESIIIKTERSCERLQKEVRYFLNLEINLDSNEQFNDFDPTRESHSSARLKDKIILIVDDDIKNLFVLTSALENLSVSILRAHNGKEALDLLQKEKVDLVLMDIMMPVMDGYEAMRAIRADSRLKTTPIIALTAKALKEDRERCLEAGADDYLSKPINYDVLIAMMSSWMDKKDENSIE